MYDRQVVRRRRAVLAVLVVLAVTLLTLSFGESSGGPLHAVQRGAHEVLAPIEEGASRALKPFRDLVGWTGDVLEAEGENDRLEKENARLRRDLAEAQTAAREVEQLRQLAGLPRVEGYPDGVELVSARVIAHSPTVWHGTVEIDKGSSDGVQVDDAVIAASDPDARIPAPGGLAGKVTSVTSNTARVTLITDSSSAVSGQIVPDGATGIVKPEVGDPNDMLLDFVEKGRKVRKGATVVTSGFRAGRLESLFPRGIPIGEVRRVEPEELELYQRVHVRPFADLRHMDFVQVVVGGGERGDRAGVGPQ
jgi:rod shape-determining protein MreC